jgi:hypothetical protein
MEKREPGATKPMASQDEKVKPTYQKPKLARIDKGISWAEGMTQCCSVVG